MLPPDRGIVRGYEGRIEGETGRARSNDDTSQRHKARSPSDTTQIDAHAPGPRRTATPGGQACRHRADASRPGLAGKRVEIG